MYTDSYKYNISSNLMSICIGLIICVVYCLDTWYELKHFIPTLMFHQNNVHLCTSLLVLYSLSAYESIYQATYRWHIIGNIVIIDLIEIYLKGLFSREFSFGLHGLLFSLMTSHYIRIYKWNIPESSIGKKFLKIKNPVHLVIADMMIINTIMCMAFISPNILGNMVGIISGVISDMFHNTMYSCDLRDPVQDFEYLRTIARNTYDSKYFALIALCFFGSVYMDHIMYGLIFLSCVSTLINNPEFHTKDSINSYYDQNLYMNDPDNRTIQNMLSNIFTHANLYHLLINCISMIELDKWDVDYYREIILCAFFIYCSLKYVLIHYTGPKLNYVKEQLRISIGISGIIYSLEGFRMIKSGYSVFRCLTTLLTSHFLTHMLINNVSDSGHILGIISGIFFIPNVFSLFKN